jgi:putative flippase GtrA
VKLSLPVVVARLIGLLAGVTVTYFFNRRFTFAPEHAAGLADWGQYVLRQSVGTALNFAISSTLIYFSDRFVWQIWGAVFLGAALGFCINFFSARRQLHRS